MGSLAHGQNKIFKLNVGAKDKLSHDVDTVKCEPGFCNVGITVQ